MNSILPFNRYLASALMVTGLMASISLQAVHAVVLFENDFESSPVGTYTIPNWKADWNNPSSNDGVDEGRVSIVNDADAFGTKSMVVMYPEGQSSSGKSQWKTDIGGSYDELYLSYRIRFDDNFDFVRGGKLPGFCGGDCNSGGSQPDGTDGWSARMMWRTDGSGQNPYNSPLDPDQANIVQYVYHPDQTANGGVNGDDMQWNDTTPVDWKLFDSDVWYHLQHRVVMNTPGTGGGDGQHDGIMQAWLDGELVLDRQDIRFRDIGSLKIDTLYFSTFFGGGSEPWETHKDEFAYYDDFVISTEYIDNFDDYNGDYNGDDIVDGADYTVWRDTYLQFVPSGTGADGDGNGIIDSVDYDIWVDNFGETAPAGAGSGMANSSVPEPVTWMGLVLGAMALLSVRRSALSRPTH